MWLKKKPQQYTSPPMSFMPREILCKIFSYLSVRDLGRLSLVCKLFKEVSENDQLWKELFIERVKSFVKWEHSFHFNISSSKDFKVLFRDELISNPQK